MTVLNVSELKFSKSWGRKANYSDVVYNEKVNINLYSESDKDLEFSVLDEKGSVLNSGNTKLNEGFNTISFVPIINVEMSAKKLKKVSFSTNKASDGNIYLGKGKYTLTLNNINQTFEIK